MKLVSLTCLYGYCFRFRQRFELFLNKFHLDYHPLAMDCMEEWLFQKTRAEYEHGLKLNTAFYQTLPFVRNHLGRGIV